MVLLIGPSGGPENICEGPRHPTQRTERTPQKHPESTLFTTPVPVEKVPTYQALMSKATQTLLSESGAIVTVDLREEEGKEQAIRTLAPLERIPGLLPQLTSTTIDKQLPRVKRGKFYPIPGINNSRAGILVLGHSFCGGTPCGTIGVLKVRNETGDTSSFLIVHLTGPETLIPRSFMLLAGITGLGTAGQSPNIEGKFIPLAFHEQKPGVYLLDYIKMGYVALSVDTTHSWRRLRYHINELLENAREYLRYRIESQPRQR